MNKYLKRTIKLIAFIIPLILVVFALQEFVLCHIDHNKLRMDGFYLEDEKSIDVVLTGASELYSGFSPGLAYEKFGYTSYPYATASITAGAAITQFKEIIRTQNPKLILVEINPFLYPDDWNESNEGSIRKYIDNVPLNQNKIDYVEELDPEHKEEFYFPLIKYHSSWSEYPGGVKFLFPLIGQHFRGYTLLKGYKSNTNACSDDGSYLNKQLVDDGKTLPLYDDSENKLRQLLKYCEDNNLNVVFFRAPHLTPKTQYNTFCRSNRAGEIIREYGFDFLNFERDSVTANYPAEDYYNVQHLNIYGSEKFTEYLGGIIRDNYHVQPSVLTDAQKQQWDEAAQYYHQFYRCCDDKIKSGVDMEINEDLTGIKEIAKYQ